jgi:hypothetical protein
VYPSELVYNLSKLPPLSRNDLTAARRCFSACCKCSSMHSGPATCDAFGENLQNQESESAKSAALEAAADGKLGKKTKKKRVLNAFKSIIKKK